MKHEKILLKGTFEIKMSASLNKFWDVWSNSWQSHIRMGWVKSLSKNVKLEEPSLVGCLNTGK